jgi:hypothetical protein
VLIEKYEMEALMNEAIDMLINFTGTSNDRLEGIPFVYQNRFPGVMIRRCVV